jgi:hypothetical protein
MEWWKNGILEYWNTEELQIYHTQIPLPDYLGLSLSLSLFLPSTIFSQS